MGNRVSVPYNCMDSHTKMKWFVIAYIMCIPGGSSNYHLCEEVKFPVPYTRYSDCMVLGLPNVHLGNRMGQVICAQRNK